MLQLKGFGIAFNDKVILDSVTMEARDKGCTVLLGPSGTGKSTLLRTLAGFNQTNPALRTWGEAIYRHAPCLDGNRPALVMQNSRLLISNVMENLVCNLPDRAQLPQRQQVERVAGLLSLVGCSWLLDFLGEKVVERPLAEQRIIAILRHFLSASPLLMIDEPTAGLKEADATMVLEVMSRLSREHALLVVLHNMKEAQHLADDVVLIANGRVQEAGGTINFFTNPQTESGRYFVRTGSCPETSTSGETEASTNNDNVTAEPPTKKAGTYVGQAHGPRGFLWVLPGRLAGTPWPGIVHDADYDLEALRAVGVTHLISLTEEPFDAHQAAPYGIAVLSSPMPDMQPPTEEQAIALCEEIDHLLAKNAVIAVHCRAGLGRTGTVLTAYWLWRAKGALSALQALEDMRRIEPRWVQSQSQVDFLEEFARTVAQEIPTARGSSNRVFRVPV